MKNFLKYFFLGVIFWVIVDYTTAFNPDFQKWISYMPTVWLFYIGCPLLFSFFIYKKKWTNKTIFILTIVAAFFLEVVVFRNFALFQFPIMLIMIPAAIFIYSFVIFVPKWIVEKKVRENKKKVVLLTIIWTIISILTLATKIKG